MTTTSPPSFSRELERLINQHSLENGSNTPDFILASFLRTALTAFDEAVKRRADWYGRMDVPGQSPRSTAHDGVIPMDLDDSTRLLVTSIAGGGHPNAREDKMPACLTLLRTGDMGRGTSLRYVPDATQPEAS